MNPDVYTTTSSPLMMVCDNCDGDFAGGDRNILQLKNGRVVLCDPCLRKLDG